MRPLIGPVPEPAERVASALRRCHSAFLTPSSGRSSEIVVAHPDPVSGDVLLAVSRYAVPSTGDTVRVEVLDVIRGGAADGHCRRTVTMTGEIIVPDGPSQRRAATAVARELADPALLDVGTEAALLRLRPESILLLERDGVTSVLPADLMTSGPDPFAELEGLWLAHLNDPRCPVLGRLAQRIGRDVSVESTLLIGIDRAGLDLQVIGRDGVPRLLRLPFAEACVGVAQLGAQIRMLAGCPRSAHPLRDRARRG